MLIAEQIHNDNNENSVLENGDKELSNKVEENFWEQGSLFEEIVPLDDEYVKIRDYIPDIIVELRYATNNNFTGEIIYNFDLLLY